MPRPEIMYLMLGKENKGFHLCRQIVSDSWQHVLVTNHLTDDCYVSNKTRERGYTIPLYLYSDTDADKQKSLLNTSSRSVYEAKTSRVPNLNIDFIKCFKENLNLPFDPNKTPGVSNNLSPEEIFYYIYAILHSPSYRARYAEFLKIDFPRIPLTSRTDLFWRLVELGGELVGLHLLEAPRLANLITRYPFPGDNLVDKGYPNYLAHKQRLYINKDQYFEGVPSNVWDFHIGGYQVCEKWLKDRRGRQLTFDDLTHYQKIIVALNETIRIMQEIDQAIDSYGGWPIQ